MSPDRPRLRSSVTTPEPGDPVAVVHDPVQDVLAAILRDPRPAIVPAIQMVFPGDVEAKDYRDRLMMLRRSVLETMKRVTGGDFQAENQQEPGLADRLTVCWEILFSADQLVKKLKPDTVALRLSPGRAGETFAAVLGTPLTPSLAASILERLRLGPEGEFARHYWVFLRAVHGIRARPRSKPAPLPPPLSGKSLNDDGLRRVAWWLIRSRRERYVETTLEPPYLEVHFGHVVDEVYRELTSLCGEAAKQMRDCRAIVEQEINAWIRYCGLDITDATGPAGETDMSPGESRALVRAFWAGNRLTQKLVVAQNPARSETDKEVEGQLRQYAAENRVLEERVRTLEAELAAVSQPVAAPEVLAVGTGETSAELRDLVRLIDAKYALDLLKGIQLGNDSPLTLRSFVSHLFYALSKKGLVPYPTEDRFLLSYEKSGLFECDGFEVKPGEGVVVTVVRRGWAIQAKERLLPVRKARVEQGTPDGSVS